MSTFYVTTPIYYVNDRPHIGHAFTTVLADVLTRYHRMAGDETRFLTGTDEHGQKVQQAAEQRGIPPKQHVDEMVVHFQNLARDLGAANDDFIRTTEDRHTRVVQHLLQTLFDQDEIYRKDYEGWYCVADEMYVPDKDVVDGLSPSGRPVTRLKESNYFFRMGKYQDWLIEHIESHPEFIQPDFRRNETLGFLRSQPLNDLCISRPKARLSWGIPLPFDDDYVTYVWFDALTNYISAIGWPDEPERFQRWWPALHLIGKDILTTHSVYWPTMLQAAGIPQPRTIFTHGWWLQDGRKIAKSDEAGPPDPYDYLPTYGVDAFRYFLCAEMSLGHDANFSEALLNERYNADLANALGNLCSRATKMVEKHFGGTAPERAADETTELELRHTAADVFAAWRDHLAGMRPNRALAEVLRLVRATNAYFDTRTPWLQAKEEDKQPLARTLLTTLEAVRAVTVMLHPVMPAKVAEIRAALGLDSEPTLAEGERWNTIAPGTAIAALTPFPRVKVRSAPDDAEAEPAPQSQPPAAEADADESGTGLISIDDFAKVQLRTAKVINAEPVEGTDKLLRLEVMVGQERRQIVSGIADYYDCDELRHKIVVMVTNLQPATIRGVESQGMLLAASMGSKLKLVTVEGQIASGAEVR